MILDQANLLDFARKFENRAKDLNDLLCQSRQDMHDLRLSVGVMDTYHMEDTLERLAKRNPQITEQYAGMLAGIKAVEAMASSLAQIAQMYYDLASRVDEGEVEPIEVVKPGFGW